MSMFSNYKPVFIASSVVVLLSGCSSLRTTSLPLAVVTDHVLQSDPRIRAVMPVVPTFRYFKDEEIGSVHVPVFMLGGEDDLNTPVEEHLDRAFSILEGSSSFLGAAAISKANHYHFTNIDQIGDAIREVGIGRPFWPLIGGERLEREYALATDPETISPQRVKEIEALYALAFFSKFLNDDHRWDLVFDPRYASLFLPEVAFRIR